jgi:hypothetical protein
MTHFANANGFMTTLCYPKFITRRHDRLAKLRFDHVPKSHCALIAYEAPKGR